jgi:hypothetical protein
MFSIAMHTEFFMFFTTQIGQPPDTSVHALLGGGDTGLLYIYMYSTCYRHEDEFNFGVSGIISKHKQRKNTENKKCLKSAGIHTRNYKIFWGDNHINLEKMFNIQGPSLLHHHKIK